MAGWGKPFLCALEPLRELRHLPPLLALTGIGRLFIHTRYRRQHGVGPPAAACCKLVRGTGPLRAAGVSQEGVMTIAPHDLMPRVAGDRFSSLIGKDDTMLHVAGNDTFRQSVQDQIPLSVGRCQRLQASSIKQVVHKPANPIARLTEHGQFLRRTASRCRGGRKTRVNLGGMSRKQQGAFSGCARNWSCRERGDVSSLGGSKSA